MSETPPNNEVTVETVVCPNCEETQNVPPQEFPDGRFPCPQCSFLISRPGTRRDSLFSTAAAATAKADSPEKALTMLGELSVAAKTKIFLAGGMVCLLLLVLLQILEVQGSFDPGLMGMLEFLSPNGVMGFSGIIIVLGVLSFLLGFSPKWVVLMLFGWYLLILPVGLGVADLLLERYLVHFFCPVGNEVVASIQRFEKVQGSAPGTLQELNSSGLPAVPRPGIGTSGTFDYVAPKRDADGTITPWRLGVSVRYRGRPAQLNFYGTRAKRDQVLRFPILFRSRNIGGWVLVEGPILLS